MATRLSHKCHVDRRTHLEGFYLRPTRPYQYKIKTFNQNARHVQCRRLLEYVPFLKFVSPPYRQRLKRKRNIYQGSWRKAMGVGESIFSRFTQYPLSSNTSGQRVKQ